MTVIHSENLTSTSQTKEHRALVMIYTTDHSVRLETMAMIMMTTIMAATLSKCPHTLGTS